ncbi:hypothetical protein [Paenibacillus sp. Soil787]|uniref:hypothetical protein n=1 Tax=Paenibacillus sp. Soil787 TaxID=1736411 RepID=UPI000700A633|nr:hypothetical protein [Paenibacillus sp. Soil787]KRF34564.1 hypothetical protein ASG93_26215 [Paenibacillus sp. Soil787]
MKQMCIMLMLLPKIRSKATPLCGHATVASVWLLANEYVRYDSCALDVKKGQQGDHDTDFITSKGSPIP